MDFARDLLAQAKTSKRRDLVQRSKAFLDKVRAAEDKKVSQALEKLGVDWSAGPATGRRAAAAADAAAGRRGDAKIAAGTPSQARGVVKNVGHTPAYRVRAVLESDNPIFDENEMVFGKIAPGESKSYELAVKVPTSSFTRTDEIKATLYTQRGATKARRTPICWSTSRGRQRPMFAYSYQTIDDQKGATSDGLVQRGEQVRTLVTVKNIGKGKALHTEAVLRNGTGQEGILISAGRFEAKELGARRDQDLLVRLRGAARTSRATTTSWSCRSATRRWASRSPTRSRSRSRRPGPAPEALTGTATIVRDDAPLRETAGDGALVVGRAPKGTGVQGHRQAGRVHARRRRRDALGVRRHAPTSRRAAPSTAR